MSTPDKCPHCGASKPLPEAFQYLCGTSDHGRGAICYCIEISTERSAHAETRKELDETKQAFETQKHAFDVMRIACEANESSARIALSKLNASEARVRELEGYKKSNAFLQSRVAVLEHELIRAHADGEQVAHFGALADARVRELEKWKSAAKAFWRAVMTENDDDLMQNAMHEVSELIELEKATLGEANAEKGG